MVFKWKGSLVILLLMCSILFYDNFVNGPGHAGPNINIGMAYFYR
ncbi:MAG TPA: hypothetical protein VJJ23_06080 [Candidatus Nanoarchaeia archaeon]|nr:hypothetical protein [Candidatus Nanoarchaeia archaeon]